MVAEGMAGEVMAVVGRVGAGRAGVGRVEAGMAGVVMGAAMGGNLGPVAVGFGGGVVWGEGVRGYLGYRVGVVGVDGRAATEGGERAAAVGALSVPEGVAAGALGAAALERAVAALAAGSYSLRPRRVEMPGLAAWCWYRARGWGRRRRGW